MEKLKLCPFCGGAAEMKKELCAGYGGELANVFVKCRNNLCGAEGAKITVAKECVERVFDSAATLWNLREGVAGETVRRGRWNGVGEPLNGFECSVCGDSIPLMPKPNFCPHCGAEMSLGAEG